jgi:hypothetical protein
LEDSVFLIVYLGTLVVAGLYLCFVNPEVVVARIRFHKGTKRWDKILLCFLLPPVYAVFLVPALDRRFHWSPVPWWLRARQEPGTFAPLRDTLLNWAGGGPQLSQCCKPRCRAVNTFVCYSIAILGLMGDVPDTYRPAYFPWHGSHRRKILAKTAEKSQPIREQFQMSQCCKPRCSAFRAKIPAP